MQKIGGVETVRVSLNEGLTVLDLKPGNSVTVATLRQVITNNGFVSKEAQVVARVAPVAGGDDSFEVSGTGERLAVASKPQRSGEDWRFMVKAPDGTR
jgi:hypothetical protein